MDAAEMPSHCLDTVGPPGVAVIPAAYSVREDAQADNFSATPLKVSNALQAVRPSVQSHHAQTFIVDEVVGPSAYSVYPESGQGADLAVREIDGAAPAVTATDGKLHDRGTRVVGTYRMQRSDQYTEHDLASTVAARDYKSATDLIVEEEVPQGVDLFNQTLTGDVHVPLRTAGGHGAPAVLAFAANQRDEIRDLGEMAGALPASLGAKQVTYITVPTVRRLTERECERLQGFPDDWTLVPGSSMSARYKQMGNAVAVPVAEWLLNRIALAELVDRGEDAAVLEEVRAYADEEVRIHDGVVAGFSAGQSSGAGSLGYQEEIAPTLRASASGTNSVPTVLIAESVPVDEEAHAHVSEEARVRAEAWGQV